MQLTACRKLMTGLTLLLTATFAPVTGAQTGGTVNRPFLNPLFTDNMVLQRGQSDPVWGWTVPGRTVFVRVAGKGARAVAGADGAWTARLPPLPVGGPYSLTILGPQRVTLHNVLVGDVWVCSGQSNMEFGVGNGNNAAQEIAAADDPRIRLFTTNKTTALTPQAVTSGQWQACSPATIQAQGTWNGFSAVGYFFGRALSKNIHVPIGLLQTSWGGTPAEAWTSEQGLRKMPDFQPALAGLEQERIQGGTEETLLAAWYQKNDPGQGDGWPSSTFDDSSWDTMTLPGYFQQAGIPALANVNGIVWFRKTLDLPAGAAGKDLVLNMFADDNDTTWVNGTQVGATVGFSVPRHYTVPAALLKPTGNVIAVRVLDTGGAGGIYGDPSTLSLNVPGGVPIPLAGSWRVKLAAPLPQLTPLPQDFNNSNTPTVLYNGMISPLTHFGIKGVLWYQGEQNAGRAVQYRTLLPTMIGDWRAHWGEGDFPFLIVQLAGWQPGGTAWAQLRQAQWLTAHAVPNAGIATAIDVGDQGNIHPTDKQDVGTRLALVAEAQVYHEPVHAFGPVYRSMTVDGPAVRLTFAHVDGGLIAKGGGPLAGFEVAGQDGTWVAADAKLDGDTVVVSSPQVPKPATVRYAWTGYPTCSLYNKAGLPAFPFRTDDRSGSTLANG